MADGRKALVAILILCGGAGLAGYNLAPKAGVAPAKPMVPKQVQTTSERSVASENDRSNKVSATVQCFGALQKETNAFFTTFYLSRDGGIACLAKDDAGPLILESCKIGEFCVLTAASAARCPDETRTREAIERGHVPLDGCMLLDNVTGARTEVKIVKPYTRDNPTALADAVDQAAKNNARASTTFEETMNFILTTDKTWSSVNFDGMWSTKITNYNQAKCSIDIETNFGAFLIAKGTLSLSGLKSWRGAPVTVYDGSRNQIEYHYSSLTIESGGSIFQGTFKQANFSNAASIIVSPTTNSCSQRCSFAVPSDTDWERVRKAISYLFNNFCTAGKPDPF